MPGVYIVGAGGFAKEVFWLLRTIYGQKLNFKGYIDKNGEISTENNIVDEDHFLLNNKPADDIILFLGLGNPQKSKSIINKYAEFSFPNAIHPNFQADHSRIEMGRGNIITAGVVFTTDINIIDFNILNLNTTVGHDVKIGSFNVINPGANISGSVVIGENNLIGTNATILQGVKIGNNSVLGAGSLANKDIEDNQIMVGVPAKPIKR
jgi:sugar O-acyltransferase (sialic acid O-acetyltransferase NeuD family)